GSRAPIECVTTLFAPHERRIGNFCPRNTRPRDESMTRPWLKLPWSVPHRGVQTRPPDRLDGNPKVQATWDTCRSLNPWRNRCMDPMKRGHSRRVSTSADSTLRFENSPWTRERVWTLRVQGNPYCVRQLIPRGLSHGSTDRGMDSFWNVGFHPTNRPTCPGQ